MEKLLNQVNEYLESKIPEVPKSTRDEISAYLMCRFMIHENEVVTRVNREWKRQLLGNRINNLEREIFSPTAYTASKKGESK